MEKTDLKKYSKLNEEFVEECNRVVSIIKYMPEYKNDIEFADRFVLEGEGTVFWDGDEYWSRGGHEHHLGCFSAEYLTMTDDELKALVTEKIDEYNKWIEEKHKKRAEEEKAARLAEYEKLKKEFGE